MSKLGVGVVGGGDIGQSALGINQVYGMDAEAVALCDINEKVLDDARTRLQIRFCTKDYEELLAREDVDIVGVYTPSQFHADQAIKALEAGKHVICTKAMCYNIQDCERIVAAVDRSGRKFMVGQTWRWETLFVPMRQMAMEGELGKLLFGESWVWCDFTRYFIKPGFDERRYGWSKFSDRSSRMGMDILLDSAVHPVDFLRWIMGDVNEVHAYAIETGTFAGHTGEDLFSINLKFQSGTIGRVLLVHGGVYPCKLPFAVTLHGTGGTVVNDEVSLRKYRNVAKMALDVQAPVAGVSSVARYYQYFADCVRKDRTPMIDARDGSKTVATCVAVWESIRIGKPCTVRNDF